MKPQPQHEARPAPVLRSAWMAGGAMAGTTGTEFQSLYTWINNVVTGYFGRAVAVAAVGIERFCFGSRGSIPFRFWRASALRFSCNTP